MSDLSRWCLRHYDVLHDFAAPVATIIAAGAAVFVTWTLGRWQVEIARQQAATATQQAATALDRLRHDLFERRIAVFDAARDLILETYREGTVSADALTAFILGTEKSVFLFDHTVTEYIGEMRNRASQLNYIAAMLSGERLAVGPEREALAKKEADYTLWFVQQSDVLIGKFRPALALENDIATRLSLPIKTTPLRTS